MADANAAGSRRARAKRWLSCSLSVWLCGCASTSPAASGSAVATAEPALDSALDSGLESGARVLAARSQGLEFPLPDAAGWRLDTRERHTWVARHLRSSSQLVVRAWRFEDIARPEDCERQARLWRRDLPQLAPADQLEQSERVLAGVYRGRVTVGVRRASREPGRWLGHILAFGSDARSCLLLAFSTTATGPTARSVITRRLAIVEGTVFQGLRRLDIESRVTVPRL